MMNVNEYLEIYCNGNKAAFARAFSRLPQNVTKIFNNPNQWFVVILEDEHLLTQIRAARFL